MGVGTKVQRHVCFSVLWGSGRGRGEGGGRARAECWGRFGAVAISDESGKVAGSADGRVARGGPFHMHPFGCRGRGQGAGATRARSGRASAFSPWCPSSTLLVVMVMLLNGSVLPQQCAGASAVRQTVPLGRGRGRVRGGSDARSRCAGPFPHPLPQLAPAGCG